ncbi:hypothetical protein BD779DRAFT_1681849 [Infundibulicybe gibba]|nr:hypothetical protein BD779DRAFT_1681849 [Infundibulicybe gibba]
MCSQRAELNSGTSDQPQRLSGFLSPVGSMRSGPGDKPTPSQRTTAKNTPEPAKKRVRDATRDLSGGRCLIENVHEDSGVQYAHCLARATSDNILTSLEFSWGMRYGTLNIDTRQNIFKLGCTLHFLFDQGQWILLPDTKIIERYYEAASASKGADRVDPETRRAAFPDIHEGPYSYRLLARSPMRRVPIHREEPPEQPRDYVLADDFTFLPFPLYNGQKFKSHIHPKFVICNAGQKLDGHGLSDFLTIYPFDSVDLNKVFNIFRAWTTYVTGTEAIIDFQQSGDPDDPGGAQSQSSSQQTKMRRVFNRKRPAPSRGGGSPTPQQGKKQKQGGQDSSSWMLDEKTLCELDTKSSGHVGGGPGKGERIALWADQVAGLAGREDGDPAWVVA